MPITYLVLKLHSVDKKYFDLILSVNENQIVRDLIEFLSLFESTTTILSASKSYPTIYLCLLLRIVSI